MNAARISLLLAALMLVSTVAVADPDIYAWYRVEAEITDQVYPGQQFSYDITLTYCEQAFAGYDILLQYDPSVLMVNNAELGDWLVNCGWEYFEYRSVGSGLMRIVAVAEEISEPGSPTCFTGTGALATIDFEVISGGERGVSPVRFLWVDCGDNAFTNLGGDTLFVSDDVFERDSTLLTGTPNIGGIDPSCLFADVGFSPEGVLAPFIDFKHGAVTIGTPSGCDPNGNGIPWETTEDVIFLINYVFLGGAAPDPLSDGDCNCDETLNLLDITRFIDYVFRGGDDPCGGDIE